MTIARNIRPQGVRHALRLMATIVFLSQPAFAQQSLMGQQFDVVPTPGENALGFRNGSIVAAPIPFRDPIVGNGLALGGGYLYQNNEQADTSFLGLGGFKTDNGSLGYGLTASVAIANNKLKLDFLIAEAKLNYDLFVLGKPIPISQDGKLAKIDAMYGFTPELSLGLGLRYLETTLALDSGRDLPPALQPDTGISIFKYGLLAGYNKTDDSIFPTDGTKLNVELFRAAVTEGGGTEYSKATAIFDRYIPSGKKNVVAARLAACYSSEESPFYDKCLLGNADSFRGFPMTQYIDESLVSMQLEYRGMLTKRFGYSVFGGAGALANDFGSLPGSDVHLAGGIGARFRLSKQFPVDFSIDSTINDEGAKLLYIYVGQRF